MIVGQGQVWWAELDKARPVVLLTRAHVAPRLNWLLVAPVTSRVRGIPTEVPLGAAEGVHDGCVANLDNTRLIAAAALVRPAGAIAGDRWPEFCRAMAKVMGC